VHYWHSKSLGDGEWADIPSQGIKQLFEPLFESAGKPAEMAVFIQQQMGGLHCEWVAYFSPAAGQVAKAVGASPCAKPERQGLTLLAGSEKSWSILF
jgi:hypothetical protein